MVGSSLNGARVASVIATGALDDPYVILPNKDRGDEANEVVGKDADHLGVPRNLSVEALEPVGRLQLGAMLECGRHIGEHVAPSLIQKEPTTAVHSFGGGSSFAKNWQLSPRRTARSAARPGALSSHCSKNRVGGQGLCKKWRCPTARS